MSVYGYVRINTCHTQPEKLSLKEQRKLIRQYTEKQGWSLDRILSDQADTSVSLDLPKLKDLVKLAESKKLTTLVIARLDRLPRAVRPLQTMLEQLCVMHNVRLVTIEDKLDSKTSQGQAVLETISNLAKWEIKKLPDQTKEVVVRKRKRGERVGHAPFGFVYEDKQLVPQSQELEVAKLVRKKRDEEQLSYGKIATFLNREKIPSKRGGKWHAETVKQLYIRPMVSEELEKQSS